MNQETQDSQTIQGSRVKNGKSTTINVKVHSRIFKVQVMYLNKYNQKPTMSEIIDQGLNLLEDKLNS